MKKEHIMKKLRVVFMGTPEFAVATLDAIRKAGHDVVAVVTTPDKPAGRGQHLRCSEVKNYAIAHQIPVLQPEKLKDEAFVEDLRNYYADIFVVVAFRMLPKCVYQMPLLGTFNVHASLLPQYRGAAPIQRAIMNGETMTGVTTFLLDEHTDTGAILLQKEVEITKEDNAGTLHDKLMAIGAELAVETLRQLAENTIHPVPQQMFDNLKPAPKIFKEDMLIRWDDTAENIYNHVRGLSPYPAAFTRIGLKNPDTNNLQPCNLKIFDIKITNNPSTQKPGKITINSYKEMLISTKNCDISVKILQIEGKKRMNIEDFLAGFRLNCYTDYLF
ncbi:MAG: methionyl-tRNA formyltransferase [Bacteroidales bacterium]|nr:methionyl-tRNA formyltransferase [Bacteroidales bacterium]